MNQVHQLVRVLGMSDGKTRVVIPLRVYQTRQEAQEAKERLDAALRAATHWRVFEPVSEGMGNDRGRVVEFLRELGVVGFNHAIEEIAVQSLIETAQPSLIIPG